jgi:predicted DNA binding CopG/RHH family protein
VTWVDAMNKSEIRELRKKLSEAARKAAEYERRSQGVSAFIRDHMLKSAEEWHKTANSLALRLGAESQ